MTTAALTHRINIGAANRVASTIRTFKWVVIAMETLTALLILAILGNIQSSTGSQLAGYLWIPVLIGTPIAAITSWVMLGWFEHTLRLLAKIADAS